MPMLKTTDPFTLESVIRKAINKSLMSLHTVHPAKVKKLRNDGTVDVDLMIHSVFANGSNESLPSITQLPVLYMGSNDYQISFPIQEGDEGLALFAERDISRFISTGETGSPNALRLHDLSDAMFLPTPISAPKRIFPRNNVLLMSNNSTEIEISNGVVKITGDLEVTGKATITDDIETLTGDVVATSKIVPGVPIKLTDHQHLDSMGGQTTPPGVLP